MVGDDTIEGSNHVGVAEIDPGERNGAVWSSTLAWCDWLVAPGGRVDEACLVGVQRQLKPSATLTQDR
jgi:hypothetical protein